VTITAGFGYTSPIWAGAGITLLGLGVMAIAAAGAKRSKTAAIIGDNTSQTVTDAVVEASI
jgi:DHA1 family inner membrane transport protein